MAVTLNPRLWRGVSLTQALRAVTTVTSTLERRREAAEVADEDTSASITAGGPSRFVITNGDGIPGTDWSVRINWPAGEPPSIADILDFTMVEMNTTTVRVENPADPEQYVDVARIDDITFEVPPQVMALFADKASPGSPVLGQMFWKYSIDWSGVGGN
jgi:hypothetical protein